MHDFALDKTDYITRYSSVEEAWSILDEGQQQMVAGFRSLMDGCHIEIDASFPANWFRTMVADQFHQLRDEYAEKHRDIEEAALVPFNIQRELAAKAEAMMREKVACKDRRPTWVVGKFDDEG